MFGSTIEYALRTFSQEYDCVDAVILPDGSMHHSYDKEMHIAKKDELNDLKKIQSDTITTPIYPFRDLDLPQILDYFSLYLEDSRPILVYADNLRSVELNLLFQYHKCCIGAGEGLGIFCHHNSHNIIHWNPEYKHWKEMQPWELREWFSLFYAEGTQEWIQSQNQVSDSFLKITNVEMLYDTESSLIKMINHCGLTLTGDLDLFVKKWQRAQQYIVDEFDLLDQIIDCTINQKEFFWQHTHVIAEAIVQQRLRTHGYEIQCDGLDIFPTDSKTLYNILEKC